MYCSCKAKRRKKLHGTGDPSVLKAPIVHYFVSLAL
jgi:hypothetical protein